MNLPAYPKYKDSGVAWLGMVPEGWEVKRLRHLLLTPLQYGANEAAEYDTPEWPRYIRITDVTENGELRPETFRSLPEDVAEKYLLNYGDVLFARSGATVGKTFLYKSSWGTCAYAGYLIRANILLSRAIPEFIKYFTESTCYWQWVSSVQIQATIQNISAEKYGDMPLPLPPLPEQEAIAAFLGRETAKIDALVEKQRCMLDLLKEKRTALISHAVTKGLNPNAKLKDSGVAWLGMVPEGWEVKAIKWVSSVQRGASPRPIDDPIYFDDDGEYAWVRISDVTASNVYLKETEQKLSDLGASLSVKLFQGELFLSIAGSVGKPCIASIPCCIHDGFVYFPYWKHDKKFLFYIFASEQPYRGLGKMGTQLNLNTDTVGSIIIGLPPLPEQEGIAAFLDRETAKIDTLAARIEDMIAKLQEYRTALITAAVTGKVDVRNL